MKWYIVILITKDWYTILYATKIIRAASPQDAAKQAKELTGNKSYIEIETMYECKSKPKEI